MVARAGSAAVALLDIDEQDAVRRHMRIYVNREQVRTLDTPLGPSDEVMIVQALSGG